MQSALITFQSSNIHYSYSGKGRHVIVCLHGYGESEHSFHFLEKHLPEDYRLITIDLPWHGKTQWKEGLHFTINDLVQIIDAILAVQQAGPRFSLLAFSMGGRLALHCAQTIPGRVEKLVLLAPDGLKVNFWYWLATQTWPGNNLFRFTMAYPHFFLFILRSANSLGLINKTIFKFVQHYIHDKTVRRQLYLRWTGMRKLKPDLPLLKNIIQQYKLPVRLLYGRYDRVIRFERAEKFCAGIESFCTLQVIVTGHQVLQEKHAGIIIQLLQSETYSS